MFNSTSPSLSKIEREYISRLNAVTEVGLLVGGSLIATAVCPILTPISALALATILPLAGCASKGVLLLSARYMSSTAKLAPIVIAVFATAITVGFVAMNALALPYTAGAFFACIGFSILLTLGSKVTLLALDKCLGTSITPPLL